MKLVKNTAAYLAGVIAAIAVVVAVLNEGEAAFEAAHPAGAAAASSAHGFVDTLLANLGHPLSHLFVQLIVVIAAARATPFWRR